jgi:mannose-6-phosphate isomerase-like protein (cupin superfamily)
MNPDIKYLLKLEDGRNEPIKDLDNSTRVVLVDKDTVGAQDITFAYCRFEAEISSHKKHVHKDAEEIIYILSGKGISGMGETELEMSRGDTMFIPRGAVHWFYNPFDEPVEMIFIYSRPSLKSAGYEIVE